MKVVILGTPSSANNLTGPEVYTNRLSNSISSLCELTVLTYSGKHKNQSLWNRLFSLRKTNSEYTHIIAGLLQIPILLFKLRPKILHITEFHRVTIILLLLKWLYRYKIVYTCHGIARFENERKPAIGVLYKIKDIVVEKCLFHFSDYIFTFSDVPLRLYKASYNGTFPPSEVITPGHTALPEAMPDLSPAMTLCFLGGNELRESAAKVCLQKLFDADEQFSLILTGFSDSVADSIPAKIHCQMHSLLPPGQWHSILKNSDFFIVPYTDETFSFAAFEALSLGIPVAAVEGSGISRLIINDKNGVIFSLNDDSLLLRLHKIRNSEQLLDRMKTEARLSIQEYTWENLAVAHITAYKKLIEGGAGDD
ncbi:MAG: glycosyltransferase [Ignavibacteria bacterium]|nr:glycosyltransferase [Ignavibacteria bacterium]